MEVKTYFDGAITQNQLISIIVAIIAIFIVIVLAKKTIRLVLTVAIVVIALIYFGVVSPKELKDVSKVVSEKGTEVFNDVAKMSDNVKVESDGGLNIQVCIEGNWYSVDDISSFVKVEDGVYSVSVNNRDYTVTDKGIIKLLEILQK